MIHESPQASLESRLALKKVIEVNQDRDLTKQQLEKNIRDNLFLIAKIDSINEILDGGGIAVNGKNSGTGLRLTTDGFILTAYHIIETYKKEWITINKEFPPTEKNIDVWMDYMKLNFAVVDQKKNFYPIDTTFWAFNPALDIALIKAVILEKPKPIEFRFLTRDLEVGDEIELFALQGQTLYNQYGTVISANHNPIIDHFETGEKPSTVYDAFLTDAYGVPGFSGGVFTTFSGEIAGLVLYIIKNKKNKKIGHAGGAKIRNIVNFLKKSADDLNKLNKQF